VLALSALLEVGCLDDEKEANKAVVEVIKRVSADLGNRPAICRKFYVHPTVIDSFVSGSLSQVLEDAVDNSPGEEDGSGGLRRLESQVLKLLRGKNGG
jgi:DNA topoisomerase-1